MRLCLIGALCLAPCICTAKHHTLLQANAGIPFLRPPGVQVRGLWAGNMVRLIACKGRVLFLCPCVTRCNTPWVRACQREASFACGLERAGKVWGRKATEAQRLRRNCQARSSHYEDGPITPQHSTMSLQLRARSHQSGACEHLMRRCSASSPHQHAAALKPTANARWILQHHGSGTLT